LARASDSGLLMASLPVESVWPTMVTSMPGCWPRPCANWSRMGRRRGSMAALLVANEMSLGMFSLSWLSGVCVTCTPVPAVACCICVRLFSM
jgi:hypothetical protein